MSGVSIEAIESVYRRRGKAFFRYALARIGDPELSRDAVQEGFARALRHRRSFRGEGPLEAWLARCVINAAHDLRPPTSMEDAGDPGEGAASDATPDDIVRAALRTLPLRQREALFLRFYLDFDYATIAETLGIETGTVSATLHAARNALARALQEVTT